MTLHTQKEMEEKNIMVAIKGNKSQSLKATCF